MFGKSNKRWGELGDEQQAERGVGGKMGVRTLFLLSPSYVTWGPIPVNREREREVPFSLPVLIDGRAIHIARWLYCRSRRTRTAAARGGAAPAPARPPGLRLSPHSSTSISIFKKNILF